MSTHEDLTKELVTLQSKFDDYRLRAHEVVKQWETATRQLQDRLTEKDEECAAMKAELAALAKNHEGESNSFREQLKNALDETNAHKSENVDAQNRISSLVHANEELTSKWTTISDKWIEAEKRLSLYEAELESLHGTASVLENLKLASTISDQEIQNLRKELQETCANLSTVTNEIKHITDEKAILNSHLQEMTTINGTLESDIAEHLDTIKTMQRALSDLQRTIDSMETDHISLSLERDRLVEKAMEQEKSIDALESDIFEQRSVTVELNQKCNSLSSTVDEVRAQLRKRQDEIFGLSTKYTRSEAAFAEIFAKMEATSKVIIQRTNETESQSKEIDALRARVEELERINTMLETQCNEIELQNEELESRRASELELHSCELLVLQCNVKAAQDDISHAVERNSVLEKDLACAQADRDFYVSELGVARRMQSDLETMIATKIEQLHQEADVAAQMQGAEHDALIASKQDVENFAKKLNQTEDENRSLQAEVLVLKKSVGTNNDTILELKKNLSEVTEARVQLKQHVEAVEKRLEENEHVMKASLARANSSLKSLESDLRSSRSENERLNVRLQRLREMYEERTEHDKITVDNYIESQSLERESLVDKYNVLYESYKELKRNAAKPAEDAVLSESRQLVHETLTKLRLIVDRCRSQEHELSTIRHDNAILHRVLESQLEGSTMVDVESVLRDRSVTVHQLNIREGPRRQPHRRNPSTLLGDPTPFQTQNSNLVAPHHGKVARRSGATAFDEHNRPSMSVL